MGYKINNNSIEELAEKVVALLKAGSLSVAFAESCTGGMVSAAVTGVPGSSEVLDLSIVTYANAAKTAYTDVTENILSEHGAVSKETAALMASGIRKRAGEVSGKNKENIVGVGITGIAGPTGAVPAKGNSPEKPVGTVYIAVDSDKTHVIKHFTFTGDRQSVREETTRQALEILHDYCIQLTT